MVSRGALAIGAICAAEPLAACRLALVLALDVSSSVDPVEDRLQRSGLAAALIAPEVEVAALAGPGPVALYVFEWSGRYNQKRLFDWRLIESPSDLLAAAEAVAGSTRSTSDFPTALGHALGHASTVLRRAPDCTQRTIDISGDGKNNEGFGPAEAYAAFPLQEVTVNALVLNAGEFEAETDLIDWFAAEVIRGPTAFIEVAQGFDDFERAMTRKLVRELGVQVLGGEIAAGRGG